MAAAKHGGHASGASSTDIGRVRPQHVRRRGILRVRGERLHGLAQRACGAGTHRLEIGASGFRGHGRKAISLDLLQGIGQFVDGIVGARLRAMAAGVVRRQLVARIGLLGGLNIVRTGAAVRGERAATSIRVQRIFGIDPVPMAGQQVTRSFTGGFFVTRENDDEVARGDELFLLQTQKQGSQRGQATLHVQRAAPVEKAIGFVERERVALPVFAQRGDDIHVR